jgi:hypothetical protein
MKYLKIYEDFNDIDSICKKYGIRNYTIVDGKVNVNGDVNLFVRGLVKLPVSFGTVTGNFSCDSNRLTTLEGCPDSVSGYFNCSDNQLTSLEGGPSRVGDDFFCSDNQLTSLEGAPINVGGIFYCRNNPVDELYSLFKDYSKVELFNYMDIVYDPEGDDKRPVIYLVKLNEFLKEVGKSPVTSLKNYNCL